MSLPAELTYVTVTGVAADGIDSIVFKTPVWLVGNPIVPAFRVAAAIQPDGSFTVQLPATNDPAWSPVNWTYAVTIRAGADFLTGSLAVPYNTVGSIVLDAAINTDVPADSGQVSYLLASARSAAGGVAGLDADGDVIDADGNKVTGGGGGGGAVDSVNGQTGIVVITAAGLGAATTAALASHEADTTAVHGIANTANLVLTNDSRLSDARTPAAHASSHASAGSDPVTIAASQVGSGTLAIARIPTGSTSSTVAIGNDSRLSDARTPVTHASSHADGGADEVSLDGSQVTTGTVAFARLPTGTSSAQVAIGNHTHAGGGGAVANTGWTYFTAGDYPAAANASFAIVSSGPTVSLAAAVGDYVELEIAGMLNVTGGGDFWEMIALTGSTIRRFGSTGGTGASVEGDPAFYPDLDVLFRGVSAGFGFVVTSNDLSAGNVTFGMAQKGAGNGSAKIYADTNYPFRMRAVNYAH